MAAISEKYLRFAELFFILFLKKTGNEI